MTSNGACAPPSFKVLHWLSMDCRRRWGRERAFELCLHNIHYDWHRKCCLNNLVNAFPWPAPRSWGLAMAIGRVGGRGDNGVLTRRRGLMAGRSLQGSAAVINTTCMKGWKLLLLAEDWAGVFFCHTGKTMGGEGKGCITHLGVRPLSCIKVWVCHCCLNVRAKQGKVTT